MLKAVLFDLDGTLLNTLDDLAASVAHAMRAMNLPPRTKDEVRLFVGNGARVLCEKCLGEGAAEAKVDELQSELKKRTTVIRYDNDKVENARDMLSREIDEAINSPLSRPTVQQTFDPNRK